MSKKVNPYSESTIEKIKNQLKAEMERFRAMDINDIAVCISKGNQKIGKTMNVSLAPLFTCGNCGCCKYFCYDIKACLQYKNVRSARARNTVLWQRCPELYFAQIRKAIKARRTNKYFRWHVSGDIPNKEYLAEMVAIAEENPDFVFWTYTKMYWIVNQYCKEHGGRSAIPGNLSIMFSEWDGVPVVNPAFSESSHCIGVRALSRAKWCTPSMASSSEWPSFMAGNCDVCLKSGTGCPYGQTSYANLH